MNRVIRVTAPFARSYGLHNVAIAPRWQVAQPQVFYSILSRSFATSTTPPPPPPGDVTEGLSMNPEQAAEKRDVVKEEDLLDKDADADDEFIVDSKPGEKKQVTFRRSNFRGSVKKHMFLLRLISGKSTREALAQLQFTTKRKAHFLALMINRAARRFSAAHEPLNGFDTTIKIARADKGIMNRKYNFRKKMNVVRKFRSKITLVLQEGVPELSKHQKRKRSATNKKRVEQGLAPEGEAISWEPPGKYGFRDRRLKAMNDAWAKKVAQQKAATD